MERIGPWAVVAVDHAFRGVVGGGMANGGWKNWTDGGKQHEKGSVLALEQGEDLRGFKCAFGRTRRRVYLS